MFQINEIGAMIKSMLHIKQYLKTGISHFFIRCNLGGGVKNPTNYGYRGFFCIINRSLKFCMLIYKKKNNLYFDV